MPNANYLAFGISYTKKTPTSHVSNSKTFSIGEQYRTKFGTVLLTNCENFILFYIFFCGFVLVLMDYDGLILVDYGSCGLILVVVVWRWGVVKLILGICYGGQQW